VDAIRSTAVLAFGPAESGKTFTMFGLEAHVIAGELTERSLGVIQRCGREVFRLLALEGGDPSASDPNFQPFNPAVERTVGTRPATAPVGSPSRPHVYRHAANRGVMYDDAVIGDALGHTMPSDGSMERGQRCVIAAPFRWKGGGGEQGAGGTG
jgi:hypothetical protein